MGKYEALLDDALDAQKRLRGRGVIYNWSNSANCLAGGLVAERGDSGWETYRVYWSVLSSLATRSAFGIQTYIGERAAEETEAILQKHPPLNYSGEENCPSIPAMRGVCRYLDNNYS